MFICFQNNGTSGNHWQLKFWITVLETILGLWETNDEDGMSILLHIFICVATWLVCFGKCNVILGKYAKYAYANIFPKCYWTLCYNTNNDCFYVVQCKNTIKNECWFAHHVFLAISVTCSWFWIRYLVEDYLDYLCRHTHTKTCVIGPRGMYNTTAKWHFYGWILTTMELTWHLMTVWCT